MSEKRFAEELREVLAETQDVSDHLNQDTIVHIDSFDEVGMLTDNAGLVVKMSDGSEFQVTIVRSRDAQG